MPYSDWNIKHYHTAMIDGKEVPYDFCGSHRREPMYKKLKYIGRGYIYSIDGIRQSYTEKDVRHFWVKP